MHANYLLLSKYLCPRYVVGSIGTLILIALLFAAVQGATPSSDATQLVLDTPLSFSSASPASGTAVTASFTIRNAGSESITMQKVGMVGRGPNCPQWSGCTLSADMEFDADIVVNPGQTYIFDEQKTYWDTGIYLARVGVKTAEGWLLIGDEQRFEVTQGLVVTEPLSIVPNSVQNNEFFTASFAVTNQSSSVLTYSRIGTGGRGPNCPPLEWSCQTDAEVSFIDNVSIAPDETWRYNQRHFFHEAGDYFFQIWVKDGDGAWQTLGSPVSMTFAETAHPARSEELQIGAQFHATFDLDTDTQILTVARDLGIDIVRVTVLWRFLEENQKGEWRQWYIDSINQTINLAAGLGLDVYINFYESPCWASSDPNKDCNASGGAAYDLSYPAQNDQDYADAYQKLVQEFGDRVDTWEVWNEPNVERFWHPSLTIADYVDMLKVVYPAIKAADANSTVLGGVIAGSNVSLLEDMYAAGAKGNFDALSIHPYADPPQECVNHDWAFHCGVEIIRSTMLAHGDERPIWFSEFGWSSYDGDKGFGETGQRDHLAEAIDLIGDWDYVPVATWYDLNERDIEIPDRPAEEHMGLLTKNLQDKPAALWLRNRPKPKDALTISTPLAFSTSNPMAGDSVTASFDIRNGGSQPITLRQIGVIVRNDGCTAHQVCTSYQDFPLAQNVTIQPGNLYTYSEQHASSQNGSHFAQVVYESSVGEWFTDGGRTTLSFAVNPASTPLPTETPTPTSTLQATPQTTPPTTSTAVPNSTSTATPAPSPTSGTTTVPLTDSPAGIELFLPVLVQ